MLKGRVFISTFLSKGVLAGIEAAQKTSLKKKNRLRVKFNKNYFPVMRLTKNGFSVEAEMAPMIRGLVDLYDGDRHLKQCLIVASKEENGLVYFDFKREAATQTSAPKDFYQESTVAALIPRLL